MIAFLKHFLIRKHKLLFQLHIPQLDLFLIQLKFKVVHLKKKMDEIFEIKIILLFHFILVHSFYFSHSFNHVFMKKLCLILRYDFL